MFCCQDRKQGFIVAPGLAPSSHVLNTCSVIAMGHGSQKMTNFHLWELCVYRDELLVTCAGVCALQIISRQKVFNDFGDSIKPATVQLYGRSQPPRHVSNSMFSFCSSPFSVFEVFEVSVIQTPELTTVWMWQYKVAQILLHKLANQTLSLILTIIITLALLRDSSR